MAVSLTSTGITFPTGNAQTRLGGYSRISTNSLSGISFTVAGISQSAKRILIVITALTTSSGPNVIAVNCINAASELTQIITAQSEYNYTYGTTGTSNFVNTGNNLFVASGYNQPHTAFFELVLVEDGAATKKYTYQFWTIHSNFMLRGNGSLTSGSTPITQARIATGSNYTLGGSMSIYQG